MVAVTNMTQIKHMGLREAIVFTLSKMDRPMSTQELVLTLKKYGFKYHINSEKVSGILKKLNRDGAIEWVQKPGRYLVTLKL